MNWQICKAIYELYETGHTRIRPTLVEDPFIRYYIHNTREILVTKKEVELVADKTFRSHFKHGYLQKYLDCKIFLESIDENKPTCRLDIEDILILKDMKEQMEIGELYEIREQIIASKETRRGVSLMFFKNEKHLEGSETLERAVKKILQIPDFPDDRDAQYLYVLHCKEPRMIVLCENLHFLKMPEIPRRHHIELWYAGGKNIEKLDHIPAIPHPIYYIGDWDHDGLGIYQAVKKKLPCIELLTPNGQPKNIVETAHKSMWLLSDTPSQLSGFPNELFSEIQKTLIINLIKSNSWIEESNDLLQLLPSRRTQIKSC